MIDKVLGWIRSITELGLAIIALGVVLQVLFGAAVPFLGIDGLESTTRVFCERRRVVSREIPRFFALIQAPVEVSDTK